MLEFFSWKKFEYGKNLCVSHSPYPKDAPECPLYRAESKKVSGLLHLGHTFRTYIQNYIQKLHFNPHQNYIRITFPRHPLPASMPIIITFKNYISNIHQNYIRLAYPLIRLPTTSFTLRSLIDILSHYNYIQNTHLELHSNTHYNYIIITLRIIPHLRALLVSISLQLHYNYI